MARARSPAVPDDAVLVEIDGPDVHPSTADAIQLLQLGSCFFRLVAANAEEQGGTLRFTNVAIRDKCAAVSVTADNIALARAAVDCAVEQISGVSEDLPRGTANDVKVLQDIISGLPGQHSAMARVSGWQTTIRAPGAARETYYGDWATIRATPLRIGGNRPTARFVSIVEAEPFTLRITKDQAREIGPFIYKVVDISAALKRSSDGLIVGGELQSFTPVLDGDPRPAWRAWFKEAMG